MISISMTKQRKEGNREIMSVVKEQVTIRPYMNFAESTVLTRFTARVIIIREVLRKLFS